MNLLATSENIAVLNLVVSGCLTVAVAYLGFKAREVATLRTELRQAAEASIEQKFQAMEMADKLKRELVGQEIRQVRDRLERGDQAFDELGDGERRLELKLMGAVADLKETMLRECADAGEMKALTAQVQNMAGRFDALERAVAMDLADARK